MSRKLLKSLAGFLLLCGAFTYGYLAHREALFPAGFIEDHLAPGAGGGEADLGRTGGAPPGRWRPAGEPRAGREPEAISSQESALRAGLPYLAGRYPAPQRQGVTLYDEGRAEPGLNFFVSGHAPEAVLMDMRGRVVHTWAYDPGAIWPDYAAGPKEKSARYWRRARLMDSGDLLAIFDGAGVIRVDARSDLVWSHRGECHHDLDVDDRGHVLVLERRSRALPRINPDRPVLEDFIVTLGPRGEKLDEISILECFENSDYAGLLDGMPREGDLFHTNTLEILDGSQVRRSAIFKRGNLLISLRHLNTIAVIEPGLNKVVWALAGMWRRQHDPVLLGTGRVLLFDNLAAPAASRVIEFDPFTQRIEWRYEGSPGHPFFSETCGTSQRLSRGNTLITESDRGRAFEVTPDGTIVWEFLNPYRAGANGELIATLFEMTRVDPDFPRWDLAAAR